MRCTKGILYGQRAVSGDLTLIQDDFDRPDSSDINSSWIQSGNQNFEIASNELSHSGGTASRALWDTALSSEHQYVEIDVVATGTVAGVVLRANDPTTPTTYYEIHINSSNEILILKNGSTELTTRLTWSGAGVLRAEMDSNTIRVFRNAVQVGDDIHVKTADLHTGQSYVGVVANGSATLDDFEAGNLTRFNGTLSSSGGYDYYTFDRGGVYPISQGTSVDVIVVAGGGAGGHFGGGGGGGIELVSTTLGSDQEVIIGAGGTVSSTTNTRGKNGGDSKFGSTTADGGGAGGAYGGSGNQNGAAGGSGGGGGVRTGSPYPKGTGGTASATYGYDGGDGDPSGSALGGGGGGGGSEVGEDAPSTP